MAVLRFPIDISYDAPGGPGVNVFHGRAGGLAGTIASQAQALADVLHTFYVSLADTSLNGGVYATTTSITLGTVTDVETDEQYSPTWTAINGGAGTALAPPVLQIVIGWRTSIAARRGMGRTFVGPTVDGAMQADGSIVTTVLDNVNAAADQLVADSQGTNDAALGVWGLQTSGGLPTDPHVLRDFTSANVRDRFAVLRSRRD